MTKGTTPTTDGMGFTDYGVNYIKAGALNGDSSLLKTGFTFVSEETHEKLARSKLAQNDVLVTIAGANVGKVGFVNERHLPANTNQAVGIVRVEPEKACPRFVYYFFKNPRTFAKSQGIGGGQAAQPNINLTVLKKFEISLPDIDQQRKIAAILSAYDDLIENNRRRIELLEESAMQLYKEWFVRFRFPGHEHVKIIDGIPEGWEEKTLFDCVDVLSGGTPKTKEPEFWDGDIPFFTPKDTGSGPYTYSTEKMITEAGLNKCNSKLYDKDTLFITARGTVGKLRLAQRPMAMNQSCYALISKTFLTQSYLYFAVTERVNHLKSRAGGAVFDAIVVDTFKKIPFFLPNETLAQEFSGFAKDSLRQIDLLSNQNRQLVEARDLLLPKLMSGKIAV